VLLAVCCLVSAAAEAQPAPGDLLATESADGSIVNIAGGGDFSAAPRFATGLDTPTGICLGPGGDVYVAEGTGSLLVATAGGDLSAALPFATGLGNAIGLACSGSQILVADNSGGRIVDATAGGDLGAATPFAEGLPLVTHLLRASDGTLYAQAGTEIFDVTAGGDFSAAAPFAFGLAGGGGLTERGAQLLAGAGNSVVDFTAGGDLSGAAPFATGVGPSALLDVPGVGLFAATGNGSGVFEISAGGDFSSALPFASGVATTFGLAGLLSVPSCGAAPAECILAEKGKLTVDERKDGKEKLALSISKLGAPVDAAALGDPVSGGTRYGVCLYDGGDDLAGELLVTRAGETCGNKPCWKTKGEAGLLYKDASAQDDGVVKLSAKGGAANKGKLSVLARNHSSKGQTALPPLAAALAGSASVTVQVVASDGACFETRIGNVKTAETDRFQGKAP
jgi:hypothetical protein